MILLLVRNGIWKPNLKASCAHCSQVLSKEQAGIIYLKYECFLYRFLKAKTHFKIVIHHGLCNLQRKFTLASGSRGTGWTVGQQVQKMEMAVGEGSWEITFSTTSMNQRANVMWEGTINTQSLPQRPISSSKTLPTKGSTYSPISGIP